jgi:hypothetical protein
MFPQLLQGDYTGPVDWASILRAWMSQHNAQIRQGLAQGARLQQGWQPPLFGTQFMPPPQQGR